MDTTNSQSKMDKLCLKNNQIATHILRELNEMRQHGALLCDVVLVVPSFVAKNEKSFQKGTLNEESNNQSEFYAHRCILAGSSFMFKSVLTSATTNNRLVMKGFDHDIFQACLNYIYGEEITIAKSRLYTLKTAAETLQIRSLVSQCDFALRTFGDKSSTSLLNMDISSSLNVNSPVAHTDVNATVSSGSLLRTSQNGDLGQDANSKCVNNKVENVDHIERDALSLYSNEFDNEILGSVREANDFNNKYVRTGQRELNLSKQENNITCINARRIKKRHDVHSSKPKKIKTFEERRLSKNRYRQKLCMEKIYNCEKCGEVCKGWYRFYKHKQLNHEQQFRCKYCSKVFAWKTTLETHEKRHEQVKKFVCSKCDYNAVSKREVEIHEQNKHLNDSYNCVQCTATFKSQAGLKTHESAVHNQQSIKCDYCDFSTKRKTCLKNHILNKHFPEQRKMWPCRICSKDFTKKAHLDRHLKDVHRQNPVKLGRRTVNSDMINRLITETMDENLPSNITEENETNDDIPGVSANENSDLVLLTENSDECYFIRDEFGNIYKCSQSSGKHEMTQLFAVVNDLPVEQQIEIQEL